MSRYRQAHPADEKNWTLAIMLILMGLIILSVVIWGVPTGLPE